MITNKTYQNVAEVPVDNQVALSKLRKATFIIQPVGLHVNPKNDFWIHMEFSFNSEKSQVVVDGYWVTNSSGAVVELSDLEFSDVQFVVQAMTEELDYQTKYYYDELESDYYESITEAKQYGGI